MAIKTSNQITFTEYKKIVKIKEWYLATPNGTDVTRETEGWTESIQMIDATNRYLWNYEEVVYSIGSSEVSDPVIIGYYGTMSPVTLYSNDSGTTDTVTLSESAANFSYLEIFLYKDETSGWWSVKVPNPNGKTVQIGTQYFVNSSTVGLQLIGKTATINGTTITPNTEFYMNLNNSTGALVNIGTQTSVKIMRVDGYR